MRKASERRKKEETHQFVTKLKASGVEPQIPKQEPVKKSPIKVVKDENVKEISPKMSP